MKSIFLILFLVVNASLSLSQNTFNSRYYSHYKSDLNKFARADAVIQTSTGDFIVAGKGNELTKMSALKLNQYGDTIWSYNADLGMKSINYLSSVIEVNDGNFVVAGSGTNFNGGYTIAILIKLDKYTGDTLWLKKVGLPDTSERFYSLKETTDKGLIACGTRIIHDSVGNGYQGDVYLVKTDSMGIVEWERSYITPEADWITSIEIADDGGFMLFGSTRTYGAGAQSMYLMKTDSAGNVLWQKTYGGNLEDWGLAMTKLQDGNYALAGASYISHPDNFVGLVVKVDPAGNIIWQTNNLKDSINQEFTGIKQLTTGEIMICGHNTLNLEPSVVYGVAKLLNQSDGSPIWSKVINHYTKPNTDQYIYGMDLCQDNGFVFAGMVRNWNTGEGPENAMWVVKTDCMGNDSIWDNAACPIKTDTPNTVIPFNLYPNPSTGAVTLDYFIPQNSTSNQLTFYNATGKKVQSFNLSGEGQVQLSLDCANFANGVYNCVLRSDNKMVKSSKLVIIK